MAVENPRVLIVDDEAVNLQILANIIGHQGYATMTAANGSEALEKMRADCPDIILLDVQMPVMNGLECLKEVRKQYSAVDLPVIMVTVKDESEDIVKALDAGANDYVTKPIDVSVLLARLRTHLAIKKKPS
ncbi:MAG: response regulator transcription factor [Candidatus Omnitrophota bacterium]